MPSMSPRTFRVVQSKDPKDEDSERVTSYMRSAGTACKILPWNDPRSEDIRRQAMRLRILRSDDPAGQEKVLLVVTRQSAVSGGLVNPTNEKMAVFIENTRKRASRRGFKNPNAINP